MTDLDKLRPEVRQALDKLGYSLTGTHNHNDVELDAAMGNE